MRMSQAVETYLRELQIEVALSTYKAYKGDLGLLVSLATVEATDSIVAFTPRLVKAYFRKLYDKGLSAETLLRHRSALAEFAKWTLRQRLVTENPMVDAPKIRRPKRQPRPYSHAERDRLLALELAPDDVVLRGLLYWAGLRVSEVSLLRWPHVRMAAPDQRGALRIVGKGNKERVVPMFAELDAILAAYVVADQHQRRRLAGGFVLAKMGAPWPVRTIEHHVAKWGERAEVAHATPHRWRHVCCTRLFERGMDIRLVQRFMGHESIATTMKYTFVSDPMMEQAMRAAERPVPGTDCAAPMPIPEVAP